MTLQASGAISLNQINVEMGLSGTAKISLNDAAVRQMLEKPSGAISMQNAYGKSFRTRFVNTVARTSVSIHTLMGSPTEVDDYVFVNNAVISASTASYALRTGTFPAGSTLTIINNSYIRGWGGTGSSDATIIGGAGGTAIYLNMSCRIDNTNGYIYAGGGGGGSAKRPISGSAAYYIIAGGGGGAGNAAGVAGANSFNLSGTDSITTNTAPKVGTATAGGAGGILSITTHTETAYGGVGGANGVAGAVGSTDGTSYSTKNPPVIGVAGAAGRAVNPNGNTLTQIAGFNTTRVIGAVS